MLVAYIPALVMIVGLLIWFFTTKFNKVGEHMFWTGLLVTLFTAARATIKLF
jgi:hypothetical protein